MRVYKGHKFIKIFVYPYILSPVYIVLLISARNCSSRSSSLLVVLLTNVHRIPRHGSLSSSPMMLITHQTMICKWHNPSATSTNIAAKVVVVATNNPRPVPKSQQKW